MTAPTLYDMAQGLMDITKAELLANGLTVPDRQVIYVGQIPADCVQLAVIFDGWSSTGAADGMVPCVNYRWAANFTVLLTRACVPGITQSRTVPSAADMSAVAYTASADAEALLDVVYSIGEHDGSAVAVSTAAPAGGLQSTILEVSLPVSKGMTWPVT